MEHLRRSLLVVLAGLLLMSLSGCRDEERITKYTIPKVRQEEVAAVQDRMLAAIIPHGDQAWFFKMSGPSDSVAKQGDHFETLIKSVRFSDDGTPEWTLPQGWEAQNASGLRFATLKIPSTPPLEVAVSSLPGPDGDEADYLLANINRWRGQLSLPPTSKSDLERETERIKLDGATAILVDLAGKSAPGGMGQPPFAAGNLPQAPNVPEVPAQRPDAGAATTVKHQVPEGWSQAANDPFSRLAFEVTDGAKKVRVTVSELGPAAGDLLTNINRWRGQVGLSPTSTEQLAKDLKPIDVSGAKGQSVELIGATETILGVIVATEGKVWFVKLRGDAELARREQPKFEAFVQSLQF